MELLSSQKQHLIFNLLNQNGTYPEGSTQHPLGSKGRMLWCGLRWPRDGDREKEQGWGPAS